MAKTLSQIVQQTKFALGRLSSDSPDDLGDSDIKVWVNDAIRQAAMRLESVPIEKVDYTPTSQTLTLDTDVVQLVSARWLDASTSKYKSLRIRELSWLERNYPDWENVTAGVPQYIIRSGTNDAILIPGPDATQSGSTLRTYGLYMQTELTDNDTQPDLPDPIQDLLHHWAAFRALDFLGETDKAGVQLTLFRSGIKSFKRLVTGIHVDQEAWQWETSDPGRG